MGELEVLGLVNETMAGSANVIYPQSMWDPAWSWAVEMQDPPFHNPHAVLINISLIQPPYVTKPLYAVVVPTIILVSLVTNSLAFFVMGQKNLRTPTNVVLVTMAWSELLTGVSSLPWSIYYLWQKITPDHEMTDFWCSWHQVFALHLPAFFHTTSIWLTCYLAIQRFFFVFFPAFMIGYTNKTNLKFIIGIISWAILSEIPKIFMKILDNYPGKSGKMYCLQTHREFIDWIIGFNNYNMYGYFYKLVFVHIVPCFLLVFFTIVLFVKIKLQEQKRKELLKRTESASNSQGDPNARTHKLMGTSTRLLFIIVIIHLMVELPVAILLFTRYYAGHLSLDLKGTIFAPEFTNVVMVIRNFLIIITYPFNFTIYFGMSSNFKKELVAACCMRFLCFRRRRPSDSDDWARRFSMPVTKSSESNLSRYRRPTVDPLSATPAIEGSDDKKDVMIAESRSMLFDESRHSDQLL